MSKVSATGALCGSSWATGRSFRALRAALAAGDLDGACDAFGELRRSPGFTLAYDLAEIRARLPRERPVCPHCGRADRVAPLHYGLSTPAVFEAEVREWLLMMGHRVDHPDGPGRGWGCFRCRGETFPGPAHPTLAMELPWQADAPGRRPGRGGGRGRAGSSNPPSSGSMRTLLSQIELPRPEALRVLGPGRHRPTWHAFLAHRPARGHTAA